MRKQSYNVIPFQNEFNHISPQDLDDIMETLKDMGYLSPEGEEFKLAFWKLLIKNK